jgi:PhnB protein
MAESTASMPPVAPHLVVDGAAKAIEFYKAAFGAVEVDRIPAEDGTRLMHAAVTINGGMVMLMDDFPEYFDGKGSTPRAFGGSPVFIHLDLPDVDATWQQALDAGATVAMPLEDQFWGDRYGQLTDPFGHTWSLATAKAE